MTSEVQAWRAPLNSQSLTVSSDARSLRHRMHWSFGSCLGGAVGLAMTQCDPASQRRSISARSGCCTGPNSDANHRKGIAESSGRVW
jgi:hypothetical protein